MEIKELQQIIEPETPTAPEPPTPIPPAPMPPGSSASANITVTRKDTRAVITQPFHVHHCLIGAGIAGASLLTFFVPDLKPTTKLVVAGLGVAIGVALVYDDLVQHAESNCDLSTVLNFVPCPAKVTVVKKP